eukprot:1175649-Prorocentrum_minimum.AAC.1
MKQLLARAHLKRLRAKADPPHARSHRTSPTADTAGAPAAANAPNSARTSTGIRTCCRCFLVPRPLSCLADMSRQLSSTCDKSRWAAKVWRGNELGFEYACRGKQARTGCCAHLDEALRL